MAESLGSAVLDLRANAGAFNRGIDGAKRKARSLDQTFVQVGRNMSRVGQRMTLGITLPLALLGAQALKSAANAEEAGNKFRVVMGAGAEAANLRLIELTKTIPLTQDEMQKLSASIQDMLVPMGLARDVAAGLSVDAVKLAGDLASFNNVGADRVMEAISSALAGMSRPLRAFGIDTSEARLKVLALSEGLVKQGKTMTKAARAQAVLIAVQLDSSDAMGDAERTINSTANSFRFLARDARILSQEIGDQLVPIILPLVQSLRDAVNWFGKLSPETQGWVVKLGLLAAALGPAAFLIGKMLLVGGKIAAMMTVNTTATVLNTRAVAANKLAVGGLMTTQARATVVTRAGTTATTAATTSVGASGLAKGLGTATLALGAFWAGWKAGEFLKDQLAINDQWYGNLLDKIGLFGESAADIRASADESAKAFGTYRTAVQIAADETERLARIAADELAAAMGDPVPVAVDEATAAFDKLHASMLKTVGAVGAHLRGMVDLTRIHTEAGRSILIGNMALEDLEQEMSTNFIPTLGAAAPALAGFEVSMKEFGIVLPDVGLKLARLETLVKSGQVPQEVLARVIAQTNRELARMGQLTPEAAAKLAELAKEAGVASGQMGDFFSQFQTGIKFVDDAVGSLGGFLDEGLGRLTEFLGPVLGDLLGAGLSAALGPLGPLLSKGLQKLASLALKGLKAIGSKILGAIKSIFGGVSAAEKAGRSAAAAFRDSVRAELGAKTLDVIALQFPNDAKNQANAAFLASIGQKFEAVGLTAQAAGEQARLWGNRLFEAEKKGGAAVEEVIKQITAATAAAIETTAATATAASELATSVSSDFAVAQQKIVTDATLSAQAQQAKLAQLAATHSDTMQTMMAGTVAAQNTIASVAIGAAAATEDAWVKSASNTIAAWSRARLMTVGQSSIIDIQILGSEAADRLADDHADAARRTAAEWERVNRDLAMDRPGGGGGDDERRRRERDRARDRGGDDGFRFSRDRGGGRGGGVASMTVNLFLTRSGRELIATDVVKMTPAILKKLGLV